MIILHIDISSESALAKAVTYLTGTTNTDTDHVLKLTKIQFRPPIALRTDLSHITMELWEIPVLQMAH